MATTRFDDFLTDVAENGAGFLDRPDESANAYAGIALGEECGWRFGGYAIPLLDPIENNARETALAEGGADWWQPFLGYHVFTTSTSTAYIRDHERWRIYMQDPKLASDELPEDAPFDGDDHTQREVYPTVHPSYPTITRYPSESGWTDTTRDRFSKRYIAYVDSPDGGRTFPIYAPKMHPIRFEQASTGWVDTWNTTATDAVEGPDWTEAGWSHTSVPCIADTVAADKVTYSIYRDVSVFDFYAEYGVYLMFAVECRSDYATEDSKCTPCVPVEVAAADCDTPVDTNPWTRIVVIASTSADFPETGTGGATTWPDVTDHVKAIVCVEPDIGSAGPVGVKTIFGTFVREPNEWYGKPHVVATPDRETLLLYVGWAANSGDAIPRRVSDFYGGMPLWAHGRAGISCFAVPAGVLVPLVHMVWTAARPEAAQYVREFLADYIHDRYQGEVLITDGSTTGAVDPDTGGEVFPPTLLEYSGQRFLFCGCDSTNLWVYYEVPHEGGWSGGVQDQLRRAAAVETPLQLPTALQEWVQDNGSYTLFLAPETCAVACDLRGLFVDLEAGKNPNVFEATSSLGGDLDIVVLQSGMLRMSLGFGAAGRHRFTRETVQLARGLVSSYGPASGCESPEFEWFPAWEEAMMLLPLLPDEEEDDSALDDLGARFKALGAAAFNDPEILAGLTDELFDAAVSDGYLHYVGSELRRGPPPFLSAIRASDRNPASIRARRALTSLGRKSENLRGLRALAALSMRPENRRVQGAIDALVLAASTGG